MKGQVLPILALVGVGVVGIVGCETGPHVEQELVDALSQVCAGQGVEQAAPYTEGPGPHPIVLLDSSGKSHSWTDKLPIEWWPASVNATELVACVGEEQEVEIETCRYEPGADVARYRYELELRVVEARTGQTLAFTDLYPNPAVLRGSDPRECAGVERMGLTRLEGSHVPFDKLRRRLGAYVLAAKRLDQRALEERRSLGGTDAPLNIVEYSDFLCPFCATVAQEIVPQIEEEYIATGKVKLVFKPLGVHGEEAELAAEAAQCAAEQNGFWEYHDLLFLNNERVVFNSENLERFAQELSLDTEEFDACFDGGRYTDKVAADDAEARQRGVNAVPTFFVGQTKLEGAKSYAEFKKAIDDELARLSGTPETE